MEGKLNCKTHGPDIHESIEIIVGDVRLSCETVDKTISKLSKCDCKRNFVKPGPILAPDWGMLGEAAIECCRCHKSYCREIYDIISKEVEFFEITEKSLKAMSM